MNEFAKTMSKWRRTIKRRDAYTCQYCGSDNQVEAHHIKPRSLFPEDTLRITNGLTLCRECHLKLHQQIDSDNKLSTLTTVMKDTLINELSKIAHDHGYSTQSKAMEYLIEYYLHHQAINHSTQQIDQEMITEMLQLLHKALDTNLLLLRDQINSNH